MTGYPLFKFLVCVPSFHYLVRSTWVGGRLNSRKDPREPLLESALLPAPKDGGVAAG